MLTVKKVEYVPMLMEVPNLQDHVKPYHEQYKITVGPRVVAKS